MTTYIIYRWEPLDEAGRRRKRRLGDWKPVAKTRNKPPRDEIGFRAWIINTIGMRKFVPGMYRVNRTQAEGEKAGYHQIFYGWVGWDYVRVDRTGSKNHPSPSKAIPDAPWSRQPWYLKRQTFRGFRKGKRARRF